MKRVLFLDDDDNRHLAFAKAARYAEPDCMLVHVYTASTAIHMLKLQQFDLVCLDHDLDLIVPDRPGCEETGQVVAEWIALHMEHSQRPTLVWVHSWNADGARQMKTALRQGGQRVLQTPFSFVTTRSLVNRVSGALS